MLRNAHAPSPPWTPGSKGTCLILCTTLLSRAEQETVFLDSCLDHAPGEGKSSVTNTYDKNSAIDFSWPEVCVIVWGAYAGEKKMMFAFGARESLNSPSLCFLAIFRLHRLKKWRLLLRHSYSLHFSSRFSSLFKLIPSRTHLKGTQLCGDRGDFRCGSLPPTTHT